MTPGDTGNRPSAASALDATSAPPAGADAPDTLPMTFPEDGDGSAPPPTPASTPVAATPPSPRRWPVTLAKWSTGLAVVAGVSYLAHVEMQTSALQSRFFSDWAANLRYELKPQLATGSRYPKAGPSDERMGYARLPDFLTSLTGRGYQVVSQAQQSAALQDFMSRGFFPPYPEKVQSGLTLSDCRGEPLFRSRFPLYTYEREQDMPALVAQTLGFIENREVLDTAEPRHNPAIEWTRLGKAVLDQAVAVAHEDHAAAGGSTLATQTEKFRHSPEGRTASAKDKYYQMVSASVRAYRDGEETLGARRRILQDYLNSLPLGAQRGWGEVHGVNDGLAAWYGVDVHAANLRLREPGEQEAGLQARGLAFRQVLSLMIAQRRPAHYFGPGHAQLLNMTASYIRLLAQEGVIGPALRDAALAAPLDVVGAYTGPAAGIEFGERNASTLLRVQLSSMLNTPRLYELDRFDLTATSYLDGRLQREVTSLLNRLRDPQVAKEAGLLGYQLLEKGDPSKLLYSFTLYERGEGMNRVRVQTDNLDQPFDINGSAKLELGSTAKLRTLVTYLEIMAKLHQEYAALDANALAAVEVGPKDRLSRWAVDWLMTAKDRSLAAMLEGAMLRKYSASPGESFFTGGGAHVFANFNSSDNWRMATLYEALRDSLNLPFIRLMRDVVYHHLYNASSPASDILEDEDDPRRMELLKLFINKEGRQFMRKFYQRHRDKPVADVLERLAASVHKTAPRLAVIYRSVNPDGSFEDFSAYIVRQLPGTPLPPDYLRKLYERHAPGNYSLADRGYLARLHPLELWVADYLRQNPKAALEQVLDAGAVEREQSYNWLLRNKARRGQNSRIVQLLEIEAFAKIHASWKRVGFPFETLVSSYATAIGSSGDRPAALAELMGILVNDGRRLPATMLDRLQFASGSPYEVTLAKKHTEGEQVLAPEIAATARKALALVVSDGTARRVRGVLDEPGQAPMVIGGKTGTGDNRLNTYTRGGGLLASKVTSRTATFVFYLGPRHFGTLTAFVLGPEAGGYKFTSALPTQILKSMAPLLKPVLSGVSAAACPAPTAKAP
ncbi:transglycosylase domain-containing protein [uncultured Sphaerotilus sp.]|uniref:transglycosylase domain-containing protein n=1 Tax=uncultured Sphaerotilus sp. TaxID=474984 RepID=UPI0030CA3EED